MRAAATANPIPEVPPMIRATLPVKRDVYLGVGAMIE
jgi:hypothetical protein